MAVRRIVRVALTGALISIAIFACGASCVVARDCSTTPLTHIRTIPRLTDLLHLPVELDLLLVNHGRPSGKKISSPYDQADRRRPLVVHANGMPKKWPAATALESAVASVLCKGGI